MKIVLANGCFDGIHSGHVVHLQQAREMGDRLIVSLTSDASVKLEKGGARPMFDTRQRRRVLRELRCVDEVIIMNSSIEALMSVLPDIFVKGPDYDIGSVSQMDREFCIENGIEIRFTTGEKFSSREIFK